eukprot:gene14271-biopygen9628
MAQGMACIARQNSTGVMYAQRCSGPCTALGTLRFFWDPRKPNSSNLYTISQQRIQGTSLWWRGQRVRITS